jgi:ABC-type Fe3+-hydroxamate transport system substrate-binding protein
MAVVVELDPLYVVGGGSFVNELVTAAGGANVFADLEQPYPRVSLEVLAERAPELLLDTTFDEARMATAQHDARAYWSRFPWVRRVEVLPQGILTLPGPDLADAALLLNERISP